MVEPRRPGDPARVGPYRVLGRLGSGGMGVVYLARSRSGRMVAVKVIRADSADDPMYRERFRREVHAARKVTSTFTAAVLEADPDDEVPWLATEYLRGLSLWEAVETFGGLPPDSVRALAAGLAEALVAIHRAGIVHRDLKPDNIILTSGGPRVIDFGIARPEDAGTLTGIGRRIGTPGFMSLEQALGHTTGPASDLFSFGTVLAYSATGREPFGSGSVQSKLYRVINVQADRGGVTEPWLLYLIGACHRRDPEDRPSAAEVLRICGAPGLSLQGTRWLPAPVAEEIDRRTAEGRRSPVLPVAPSRRPAYDAVTAGSSVEGPAESGGSRQAARSWMPTRRALLGGAIVLSAGALAAGDTAGPWPPLGRRRPAPPSVGPRWKRSMGGRFDPGLATAGAVFYPDLAVAGGVLLATGGDYTINALDPATGSVLWRHAISDMSAYGTVGDIVCLAYHVRPNELRLSAVRAGSGATLWTYRTESAPAAVRLAVGDVVAFSSAQGITALSLRDGRVRWITQDPDDGDVLAAGDVLAVSGRYTDLIGLDPRDGRTLWTYDYHLVGSYSGTDMDADVRVHDGVVLVRDPDGVLHAVHAGTGKRIWRRPIGHLGRGFACGGGNLYVSRSDGSVLALRAATGEVVWSRRLGHRDKDGANRLGLDGDTLYVGCADGNVYALDTAGGRLRWTYGADMMLGYWRLTDHEVRPGPVGVAGLVFVGSADGCVRAFAPPGDAPDRDGGTRARP